ncbi:MAG: Zn-ribbon domain-containing OB-fold protein, partial [Gammaproteobacteria bacterium]
GSDEWSWRESSGLGEIYTWTVCYMPMSREFDHALPYPAVVVEMAEGVRLTAGLRDLEVESLAIGLPVEVVFEPLEGGGQLPFFRPCRDPR